MLYFQKPAKELIKIKQITNTIKHITTNGMININSKVQVCALSWFCVINLLSIMH